MTKLLLFPYAGSLGLGYTQWLKPLAKKFEVHRIVYTELSDEKYDYSSLDWESLIDIVFEEIAEIIKEGDYVLFGHSMGSRVIYDIYRRILANQLPIPNEIIFSGCRTLEYRTKTPDLYTEQEFRDEYISLGGISDQVLECKELADLAFDELRKDVKLLSQYRYVPVEMKCPVTVLNGERDKISSKEEWETLLGTEVDWKLYKGKHFFIYDFQDDIIEELYSLAK